MPTDIALMRITYHRIQEPHVLPLLHKLNEKYILLVTIVRAMQEAAMCARVLRNCESALPGVCRYSRRARRPALLLRHGPESGCLIRF